MKSGQFCGEQDAGYLLLDAGFCSSGGGSELRCLNQIIHFGVDFVHGTAEGMGHMHAGIRMEGSQTGAKESRVQTCHE